MSEQPGSELPDDPFDEDLPSFNLEGPHAAEIIAFVHEYAAAKYDYSALLHQRSLRELHNAISALDEKRLRIVLLRAICASIARHMNDGERFAAWVEMQ